MRWLCHCKNFYFYIKFYDSEKNSTNYINFYITNYIK